MKLKRVLVPGQGQGWDMFHLLDGDGLSLGVNFADLYPDPIISFFFDFYVRILLTKKSECDKITDVRENLRC